MRVRSNLLALKNQLESLEHRHITGKEIAEATGLSRHTVNDLINDTSKGVYFETMAVLLEYFRKHGIEASIQNLFYEEEG